MPAAPAQAAGARRQRRDRRRRGGPGDPDAAPFLGVRLARLTAAAEDAVAAARDGNTAAVRRHVRQFETLTSAVWTVQHVLHGAAPSRQALASSAQAGLPIAR